MSALLVYLFYAILLDYLAASRIFAICFVSIGCRAERGYMTVLSRRIYPDV